MDEKDGFVLILGGCTGRFRWPTERADPAALLKQWNNATAKISGVCNNKSWKRAQQTQMLVGFACFKQRRAIQLDSIKSSVVCCSNHGSEIHCSSRHVVSMPIVSAFWLGHTSGLMVETGSSIKGLFGTAVATVGMFCITAYVHNAAQISITIRRNVAEKMSTGMVYGQTVRKSASMKQMR